MAKRTRDPRPGQPVPELLPENPTLPSVRDVARDCKACDLYKKGTQTVFGEGPSKADIMLVGEQPGDAEDLAGHPFVGPAGRLLDRALEEAGIDRSRVYVTNVVKHFKWEARGKRRIHQKPNAAEIGACRPWLDGELAVLRPQVIVCLGATAAQALLGRAVRVTRQRREALIGDDRVKRMATYHPSAVLRAPDDEAREKMLGELTQDLRKVAALLGTPD